jgi:ribosomal protein S20
MPIIKSAIKRAKQTEVRRARNLVTKRALKTEVKKLEAALAAKDGKQAQEALQSVYSKLDIAGKKNLMHRNKVARKKASFSKQVATLGVAPVKKTTPAKAAIKATSTKKTTTSAKTTPKKAAAKKPAATTKK